MSYARSTGTWFLFLHRPLSPEGYRIGIFCFFHLRQEGYSAQGAGKTEGSTGRFPESPQDGATEQNSQGRTGQARSGMMSQNISVCASH